MKLLLDEMYSFAVAQQLRRRGHDVFAVAERADLRGTADEDLFAWAQAEDRVLITDTARDYLPLHDRHALAGRPYGGLVLTSNRRFPRGQPATTGSLVIALDAFLPEPGATTTRDTGFLHWLR